MQKLYLVWFAICIAGLVLFNIEYDFSSFINNFQSIGRFSDIFQGEYTLLKNAINSWQVMRDTFLNLGANGNAVLDFLKGVLYFFGAIGQLIVMVIDSLFILPIKLLIYIINFLLHIVPLDGGVNVV